MAALMVLNSHLLEAGLISLKMCSENIFLLIPAIIIGTGHTGVELFFFISGFCLCWPYVKHQFSNGNPVSLRKYFQRRVFKILPSYIFALTVIAFFIPIPSDHIPLWEDYLLHLFFLHNFNPHTFTSIAGSFWSLAIEVEFYVVFPLIITIFQQRPIHVLLTSIFVSISYKLIIAHAGLAWTFFYDYQLFDFIDIFIFGMTAAYVIARFKNTPHRFMKNGSGMTMISICAVIFFLEIQCFILTNKSGPETWYALGEVRDIYGLLLFMFVVSVYFGKPWIRNCLEWKVLNYFSMISYNLYLWNKTIIIFLVGIVSTLILPQHARPIITVSLVFGIPIIIATVLTWLVERPFLRLGSRSRSGP